MHDHTGNLAEMEAIWKNQMEMVEIKSTVTEMNHVFGSVLSGLGKAEEKNDKVGFILGMQAWFTMQ